MSVTVLQIGFKVLGINEVKCCLIKSGEVHVALNVDIDSGEVKGRRVIDGSRVYLAATNYKNRSSNGGRKLERNFHIPAEIKLIGVAAGLASNDDIVAIGQRAPDGIKRLSPHDDRAARSDLFEQGLLAFGHPWNVIASPDHSVSAHRCDERISRVHIRSTVLMPRRSRP